MIDNATRLRLIQEDPNLEPLLKPMLRGRAIQRYQYADSNKWLINTHNGLRHRLERIKVQETYPILYQYLEEHADKLLTRTDQGSHWTNLRSCAYLEDFDKPKVVWGEIADKAKFTYDDEGKYLNNTMFMMTGDKIKYLLAILNSKAAQWFFEQIATTSGMGTNRWFKYKVEQLPIPQPDNHSCATIDKLVDSILHSKRQGLDTHNEECLIDAYVMKLYAFDSITAMTILADLQVPSSEQNLILDNLKSLTC